MPKKATNEKPIPHIPLPFEEVMKDVLKVKPPQKVQRKPNSRTRIKTEGNEVKPWNGATL
ncbi:MAG: hypothetical protein WB341_07795 [Terracidiphilus sp.]